MSVFGNRVALVDETSQTRDMENTYGPISVLILNHIYVSSL